MHRIVVALVALLLSAQAAVAGIDNAGTTAGNFLSAGTGPAVLSMGGATLGAGADLHAAAWNPAALARVPGTQFALTHGGLADQLSQEWAAAGGRLGHGPTRWSVSGLYQGESGFDGRDALGQSTGAFGISSLALGAAIAHPVGTNLTVGLGTKFVNENLGTASGSAIAFDAGVQATAGDFGFGLAARNVGGKMKYDNGSFALPGNVGMGVAWRHPTSGVRLALDANFPSAYYNDVRLGAEYRWEDRVALRGGYRMELGAGADDQLGGPTFGLGTGVNGVWLDYAFLSGSNGAAAQHRLGLSFHPGQLAGAAAALRPTTEPAERAPRAAEKPRAERASRPAEEPAPTLAPPVRAERPKKPVDSSADAPAAPAPKPAKAKATEPSPEAAPVVEAKPVKSKSAKRAKATDEVSAPGAPAAPAWTLPAAVGEVPATTPAPRTKQPRKKTLAPTATVRQTPHATPVEPVVEEPVAPAVTAPAPKPVVKSEAAAKPAAPIPVSAPVVTPAKVESPVAPAPRPATIVVRSGETLQELSKRWDVSVTALMMENNLVSENVKPGKTLKLPPAGRR